MKQEMNKKTISTNNPSDQEIIENFKRIHESRKRMFHYTSIEAFYKIIEGIKDDAFTFRAGSIYTMNDSQEMVLGYKSIMKCLPIIEDRLKIERDERISVFTNSKSTNRVILEKFCEWLINDDITNFVVSFSAASDILPMWTHYGGMGTGVCLVFSPYIIEEYYKQEYKDIPLLIKHCVYNEDKIQEFLLEELKVEYKTFLNSYTKAEKIDPVTKMKCLASMCGITGAFVKHLAFEYEQEIRMNIFRHKEEWKCAETRNGHHSVYVEVAIPTNALTNIIVGPAANMDKEKNALTMALRTKGIKIEPVQSKIPYRLY